MDCLQLCREVPDCVYVTVGTGMKKGLCFWEENCTVYEQDYYNVYQVFQEGEEEEAAAAADISEVAACPWSGIDHETPASSSDAVSEPVSPPNGATLTTEPLQSPPTPRPLAPAHTTDGSVDLLITEEGWGLSSANWLIRRSQWSIDFLERAFRLCHEEMPLYGDQDAMIHLLLNERAVSHDARGDAVNPHASVIPQREINAYDALNAFYMEADEYADGDLLVTFPGCKDASACNPLFRLAAARGEGISSSEEEARSWPHIRLFGPPRVAAELYGRLEEMRTERRAA